MATRDSSKPTAHTDENGDVSLDRVGVTEPAPGGGVVTNGRGDDGSDRDGDGLSDAYEDAHGTDSFNADSDGDGLSDGDEKRYGTDAHNADSDGDGVSDGMEATHHSNPLSTDTDGDGFSDGTEYGWGFPDAASVPNPANATPDDIDGDGVSNKAEQLAGTSVLADGSKLAGGPGDAAVVQQYYEDNKTGEAGHDLTLRQELGLAPTKADEDALLTQVGDLMTSPDIVARDRAYTLLNEQYGEKPPEGHEEAMAKYETDRANATVNRDEAAFIRAEEAQGRTPTAEDLAEFKTPSLTEVMGIERQQQLLGNETAPDSPLGAVEAKLAADAENALVNHDRAAFVATAGAKGPTKEELDHFDHPTTADTLGAAHQAGVMGTTVPAGSYLDVATTDAVAHLTGSGTPSTVAPPASGASTSTTGTSQGADRVDRGDPSGAMVDHSHTGTSGSTSTGSTGSQQTAEPVTPTSTGSSPGPSPSTGNDVVVNNPETGETTMTRSDGSVTVYGAGGEVTYDSRAEHDAVAAGGSASDWKQYNTSPPMTGGTGTADTTTVTVEAPDGSSSTSTTATTSTSSTSSGSTTSGSTTSGSTTSGSDDDDTTTTTTTTTTSSGNDDDDSTTTTEEEDEDEGEMRNPDDGTKLTGHTAEAVGTVDAPVGYIGTGTTDGINPSSGFGATGVDGTVDAHRADPFGGTRDPSDGGDPTAISGGAVHVATAQPEVVRPDLAGATPTIEGPPDQGVNPYADDGRMGQGYAATAETDDSSDSAGSGVTTVGSQGSSGIHSVDTSSTDTSSTAAPVNPIADADPRGDILGARLDPETADPRLTMPGGHSADTGLSSATNVDGSSLATSPDHHLDPALEGLLGAQSSPLDVQRDPTATTGGAPGSGHAGSPPTGADLSFRAHDMDLVGGKAEDAATSAAAGAAAAAAATAAAAAAPEPPSTPLETYFESHPLETVVKDTNPDADTGATTAPTAEDVAHAVTDRGGAIDVVQGFGGTQVEGGPPANERDLYTDPSPDAEAPTAITGPPEHLTTIAGPDVVNPSSGFVPTIDVDPSGGHGGGDGDVLMGQSFAATAATDDDAPPDGSGVSLVGEGSTGIQSVDASDPGTDPGADVPPDAASVSFDFDVDPTAVPDPLEPAHFADLDPGDDADDAPVDLFGNDDAIGG